MRNSLLRSITANPWTSIHDALLGVSVLCVAGLLAIELDLFRFGEVLTAEERRISLAEAIALTVLLAVCIAVFIYRRVQEQWRESARRAAVEDEMRELRDQAMRDPLTDLANRRAILGRLNELEEDGRTHAFFLLDLNDFKAVNDRFGHTAGDNVLQVVAERFKRVTRPSDLLARLGGDEFAILAYDVDRAGAEAVGARFISTLANMIWVDGVGHEVGVSIGVVMIPADGVAAPEILANADVAMYRAKAAGQSRLVFFRDSNDEATSSPQAMG